jgi:hypothetical protein
MKHEIKPYVGFDQIKFGMTADAVRSGIGGKFHQFEKTFDSEMLTDAFEDKGIHVYYKKPGVCEAIEFGYPADPLFMGNNLIGEPFKEVKKIFLKLDDSIEIDDTGFTSYKFGIGVFVPTLKKSTNEIVQGVIVFEKGYYSPRQVTI